MNRSLGNVPIALVFALLASGCMKTTIAVQPTMGTPHHSEADHRQKAHFFLFGLVGETTIDTRTVCPQGAHWMQSRLSVVDSILGGITYGIYTPRSVAVKCASGAAVQQPAASGAGVRPEVTP